MTPRRLLCLWLPHWPMDRRKRTLKRAAQCGSRTAHARLAALETRPAAFIEAAAHGPVLTAVNSPAAQAGLHAGQRLTDARTLIPELVTDPAEPAADARALGDLAVWLDRYSPFVAQDAADRLMLDISGIGPLFGGDRALAEDLARRLAAAGVQARLAVAGTKGAARALALAGPQPVTVLSPQTLPADALAPLPLAALDLTPQTLAGLKRLGLRRIGDLIALPRTSLARRFRPLQGEDLLARLDRALGRRADPLNPDRPAPRYAVRRRFAEPIAAPASLAQALQDLAAALARDLTHDHQGARQVQLIACRVDGSTQSLSAGTARASRDPAHLVRLFAERLACVDPGFGLDAMILSAPVTEPLEAAPAGLDRSETDPTALAALLDRLAVRFSPAAISRPTPQARHRPEAADRPGPATAEAPDWPDAAPPRPPRPVRLLDRPAPVEVMAEIPDGPPLQFRWRRVTRKVARAAGPERIAPDWWADADAPVRDYYRVEDGAGRRYWLYRAGPYGRADQPPHWYLHGLFG